MFQRSLSAFESLIKASAVTHRGYADDSLAPMRLGTLLAVYRGEAVSRGSGRIGENAVMVSRIDSISAPRQHITAGLVPAIVLIGRLRRR